MGVNLTQLHMGATNSRSFRGVEVSTLSHIAILLLISILAIIHLKPIIQPLVVATLLFFLIRPLLNGWRKNTATHWQPMES